MACRTSIERRVWAVAVALGLCVVAPAVEAQQVVKLAAGVPLTGPLAKQGQEVADAVKLAAEEWNKKGGVLGRKIEVLEADDQGNPQVGVAAAEKVAADAAVLGAVWGITSVTCIPVSEVLDRVNLVLISPGCTNPKVTDRGLKNTNRVCARDDAQGPAGAIFAVQRSEEHTSELQSPCNLVCRLLLEKKKYKHKGDMARRTDKRSQSWPEVWL